MLERLQIAPQGPEFSEMIMGYWRLMSWSFTPQQLVTFIEQHLELGITTTDHADIYGDYLCEAEFGKALKLAPSLRHRLELVTKCGIATTANPDNAIGHYITDAAHIEMSAENSLRHFSTDYLDLLLIHRPDPLMDADEVAEAFTHLHQSGKVRHFGVSNFSPAQFSLLQSRLPFTLVTNQVEISPLHQPLLLDGTLDQCQQLRIRPMAWSCLGGGRLFTDTHYGPLRDELEKVREEAGAENIEQVVYAWIMRLPSQPLPVIGSGKIDRIRAAAGATSVMLSRQQWFASVKRRLATMFRKDPSVWAFSQAFSLKLTRLKALEWIKGKPVKRLTLIAMVLATCGVAHAASEKVELKLATPQGAGASIGTITVSETPYGLTFTPSLKALPPGIHGFHVHANGSCDPQTKEGKVVPAGAAGGHFDPQNSGKHLGPYREGHLGDLPALYVTSDGMATYPVLAPRIKKLDEIKGKALMVHVGGDNHADQPEPLGGGGDRLACGVI